MATNKTTDVASSSFVTYFWRSAPFIFVAFWSGGFAFALLGMRYIEPLTMLAMRYILVLIVILPIFLFIKVKFPREMKHWVSLMITGSLIQVGYFGGTFLGMKSGVMAGTAAIVMSLQPLLVACFAPVMLREHVGLSVWVGLLFGFIGACIVILASRDIGDVSLVGLGFVLVALASMTLATLFEKKQGFVTHPLVTAIVHYVVGVVFMVPLALVLETQTIVWSLELLGAMTYLVGGNSIIAISLLIGLIKRGEASKVSALFYVVIPLALIWAWILLDEVMPDLAWVGLVLCLIGIGIVNRRDSANQMNKK